MRLYAFPYAGGGASVYFPWAAPLGPEIEVWAVRLPGRETRLREPAFTSFPALLAALAMEVAPKLRPPYAFFGHSLGAIVAFAFARALQHHPTPGPSALVVSGARSPDLPNSAPLIGDLPDAALIAELRDRYNGIPPAVLAHPELLDLVLGVLRADIRLYENYRHIPAPPLSCPLAAFGGVQDPIVSVDDLARWQPNTTGAFQAQGFDGDHFFVHRDSAAVINAIKRFSLSSLS